MKKKIKYRKKYYAIYSKKDNFLYGAFELSADGLKKAKHYINNSLYKKDLFIKQK